LNESALISVQKNKKFIDRECLDEAVFRKLLKGHAKDDAKRNADEIKLVAWHEAGHAVLGKLAGMDVSKVTIIPSTSGAGGVNIIIPKKMGLYTIEELKAQVRMSYAGRCAEYLLFGDKERVTTGASSDIKQATELIYAMISHYGMTEEYGMLNLADLRVDNSKILDKAVKLAKELEAETLELLQQHRAMHQEIVDVLIERETISGDELTEIFNKHMGGSDVIMQD
jgi:cell division protease FtsH